MPSIRRLPNAEGWDNPMGFLTRDRNCGDDDGQGGDGELPRDNSGSGDGHAGAGGGDGDGGGGGGGPPPPPGVPYPMNSPRRGVAFIVDIVDFPLSSGLQRRDGSMEEMRENGLNRYFDQLGFDCKPLVNAGSDLLHNLPTYDRTIEEYRREDAVLVCIMSHLEQGYIYDCQGTRVSLDRVFAQFRICETLRNKPKIFFVQACRGEACGHRFVPTQVGQLNTGVHEDCLYIYSVVRGNDCPTGPPNFHFVRALRETIIEEFDL